jgi:hypothetical protein
MGKSETPLLIFDFFSGTGSSTRAFEEAGDRVISFELDPQFTATENINVLELTPEYLIRTYGQPDFIWASPPCTAFSVASIPIHWIRGGLDPQPKSELAFNNQRLVAQARMLVEAIRPKYGYIIENPRGMLRKLSVVAGLPRQTISYCQYGDDRMKPTDLWGFVPGWTARPICKFGAPCHVPSPRGDHSGGTQGRSTSKDRSMIPSQLGLEIRQAIIRAKESE